MRRLLGPRVHDLSEDELCRFWTDVAAVGSAISDLFQPVKIANLSMGFRMLHFHCHVYPQYSSDDPYRLIDVTEGDVRLAEGSWEKRLEMMRERLAPTA